MLAVLPLAAFFALGQCEDNTYLLQALRNREGEDEAMYTRGFEEQSHLSRPRPLAAGQAEVDAATNPWAKYDTPENRELLKKFDNPQGREYGKWLVGEWWRKRFELEHQGRVMREEQSVRAIDAMEPLERPAIHTKQQEEAAAAPGRARGGAGGRQFRAQESNRASDDEVEFPAEVAFSKHMAKRADATALVEAEFQNLETFPVELEWDQVEDSDLFDLRHEADFAPVARLEAGEVKPAKTIVGHKWRLVDPAKNRTVLSEWKVPAQAAGGTAHVGTRSENDYEEQVLKDCRFSKSLENTGHHNDALLRKAFLVEFRSELPLPARLEFLGNDFAWEPRTVLPPRKSGTSSRQVEVVGFGAVPLDAVAQATGERRVQVVHPGDVWRMTVRGKEVARFPIASQPECGARIQYSSESKRKAVKSMEKLGLNPEPVDVEFQNDERGTLRLEWSHGEADDRYVAVGLMKPRQVLQATSFPGHQWRAVVPKSGFVVTNWRMPTDLKTDKMHFGTRYSKDYKAQVKEECHEYEALQETMHGSSRKKAFLVEFTNTRKAAAVLELQGVTGVFERVGELEGRGASRTDVGHAGEVWRLMDGGEEINRFTLPVDPDCGSILAYSSEVSAKDGIMIPDAAPRRHGPGNESAPELAGAADSDKPSNAVTMKIENQEEFPVDVMFRAHPAGEWRLLTTVEAHEARWGWSFPGHYLKAVVSKNAVESSKVVQTWHIPTRMQAKHIRLMTKYNGLEYFQDFESKLILADEDMQALRHNDKFVLASQVPALTKRDQETGLAGVKVDITNDYYQPIQLTYRPHVTDAERFMAAVQPNEAVSAVSYPGHLWTAKDQEGEIISEWIVPIASGSSKHISFSTRQNITKVADAEGALAMPLAALSGELAEAPIMREDGDAEEEPKGECRWVMHKGIFASEFAGNITDVTSYEEAQQGCMNLGSDLCKAVTCSDDTGCTMRGGMELLRSTHPQEVTYVPTPECYQFQRVFKLDEPWQVENDYKCPICDRAEIVGRLPEKLRDASGLAESRLYPGLFYTANDDRRGGEPGMYLIKETGDVVTAFELDLKASSHNHHDDIEAIQVGPCSPTDMNSCVFLADVGKHCARLEGEISGKWPECEEPMRRKEDKLYSVMRFPEQDITSEPREEGEDGPPSVTLRVRSFGKGAFHASLGEDEEPRELRQRTTWRSHPRRHVQEVFKRALESEIPEDQDVVEHLSGQAGRHFASTVKEHAATKGAHDYYKEAHDKWLMEAADYYAKEVHRKLEERRMRLQAPAPAPVVAERNESETGLRKYRAMDATGRAMLDREAEKSGLVVVDHVYGQVFMDESFRHDVPYMYPESPKTNVALAPPPPAFEMFTQYVHKAELPPLSEWFKIPVRDTTARQKSEGERFWFRFPEDKTYDVNTMIISPEGQPWFVTKTGTGKSQIFRLTNLSPDPRFPATAELYGEVNVEDQEGTNRLISDGTVTDRELVLLSYKSIFRYPLPTQGKTLKQAVENKCPTQHPFVANSVLRFEGIAAMSSNSTDAKTASYLMIAEGHRAPIMKTTCHYKHLY